MASVLGSSRFRACCDLLCLTPLRTSAASGDGPGSPAGTDARRGRESLPPLSAIGNACNKTLRLSGCAPLRASYPPCGASSAKTRIRLICRDLCRSTGMWWRIRSRSECSSFRRSSASCSVVPSTGPGTPEPCGSARSRSCCAFPRPSSQRVVRVRFLSAWPAISHADSRFSRQHVRSRPCSSGVNSTVTYVRARAWDRCGRACAGPVGTGTFRPHPTPPRG